MSTIACFVALPHHTRFTLPVMEALQKKGHKICYFTTASDFPFELNLMEKNRLFITLQNYLKNNAPLQEQVKRSIKDFYTKWIPRMVETDNTMYWSYILQENLIDSGIEEVLCINEFFKNENPDIVCALHERNRWGKIIGFFAHRYNIPYVTWQEGDYYEERLSFSSHTEYTTKLLLWGKSTKDYLTNLGCEAHKLIPVGNTHLSNITHWSTSKKNDWKKTHGIRTDKPIFLFLVGLQWAVSQVSAHWGDFLKGFPFDDYEVIMKWHPKVVFNSFEKGIKPIFQKLFPQVKLFYNTDYAYPLLQVADYCLAMGKTTMAVEALNFGCKVFSIPGKDGEPDHIALAGGSVGLTPGDWSLLQRERIGQELAAISDAQSKFLTSYFHQGNQVAITKSVEEIEKLLTNPQIDVNINHEEELLKRIGP